MLYLKIMYNTWFEARQKNHSVPIIFW